MKPPCNILRTTGHNYEFSNVFFVELSDEKKNTEGFLCFCSE